ncbi:unnamed protein product, partial [Sphagnum compactum]
MLKILAFISCTLELVIALDNGLARTPPMGWLSWERFGCVIDCQTFPDSCINEKLYKEMADRIVEDGFKDLGYDNINIDDCWSEMQRDSDGKLVADKKRFPNGMKALADYMHSKGLKLGIYGDVGTKTCKGYPAQYGHYEIDAKTFAEWGIDSVKFDSCNEDPKRFDTLVPQMEKALNATGRKMLFNCEWPGGQVFHNITPNYDAVVKTCNIFRNYEDIFDLWNPYVTQIIDYYAANQELFSKYNGPGQFFDPDMLVIGNFGLSLDQSRAQMALWAIWSSPLYMSNDLRKLSPEFKKILQNKNIIAVDQDKLGIMGKRVIGVRVQVWVKPMTPIINEEHSYAIVYFNTHKGHNSDYVSISLFQFFVTFTVYDLFEDEGKEIIATLKASDNLKLLVNPAG